MVTIADVAARAGVSVATVSRVLNGTKYVAPEPTQRVWDAVQALDYRPNQLARGLKRSLSQTVGLVVADLGMGGAVEFVKGVGRLLAETDVGLFLCDAQGSWAREAEHLESLLRRRVDGLLILPVGKWHAGLAAAQEAGVPIVFAGGRPHGPLLPAVLPEFRDGMRQATARLLDLGHRRVAFVAGPLATVARDLLFAGYRAALADQGVAFDPSLARTLPAGFHGGHKAVVQLRQLSEPPTAILVADEGMAAGAWRALLDLNIAIPDDASLLVLGDNEWARALEPPLSVLVTPGVELGILAARHLVQAIYGEDDEQLPASVPLSLVERGSVAGPPGKPLGKGHGEDRVSEPASKG